MNMNKADLSRVPLHVFRTIKKLEYIGVAQFKQSIGGLTYSDKTALYPTLSLILN